MNDTARLQLDVHLARAQVQARVPSIAAAVVRQGEVVWSGAVGAVDGAEGAPATADTQYRVGSITKTMVAVGVMRLVAEGSVALTDSIRHHLPELDESLAHVTLTQLLTQSAGLAAETTGSWWERSPGTTWDELLPSIRLIGDPGRRFHYSNVGFAVLGQLLERHRGRPWADVLTDEVWTPLAMTRTSYAAVAPSAPGLAVHPYADLRHVEPEQDTGAMAPAGQVWSTVEDLGRWASFLAAGDEAVLPDALRRSMHVPAVVCDSPGEAWTRCYGLGLDVLNIDGRRFVGHGGSMPGFIASVLVDPDTGTGAATLTNSTAGPSGQLALALVDLLEEHAPLAPEPWRTSDSPDADLVGTWFWGPRPYSLTTRPEGGLDLGPAGGGGRWSRFIANSDGTWTGQDDYWAGETLRVIDRGTASVHLDLGSFRLTRTPYDPASDIPGGVDESGWHA
ncbi:serine hydrolase domain-containing protein [Demetria terragena]|uniref:serine hydrolase domain-containing protein n=1 Tax=Demetria terragena TaxID=63959 RepID=UPI000364AC88|nr:serine hydrolase domain-containing protein [Demetria terragena]